VEVLTWCILSNHFHLLIKVCTATIIFPGDDD
jgi:REP element-mobilizing transposase RayT